MSAVERAALGAAGVEPDPPRPSAPEPDPPRTFAALTEGGERIRCRRCGSGGTHRFSITVNDQRRPSRSGNGPSVAHQSWRLCEACAVAVFVKMRDVLR